MGDEAFEAAYDVVRLGGQVLLPRMKPGRNAQGSTLLRDNLNPPEFRP